MYFLSYHELILMGCDPPDVPGPRVAMSEEKLFGCWLFQHQSRIMEINFGCEGTCFHDQALKAWDCFPELVEYGDPGGPARGWNG